MKAVLLKAFGGPENLYIGEAERPTIGAGQVLVRVQATSVNRPDIVQRTGNYPPPKGDSEILGLDIAGIVEEVGAGVERWRPGDRVMGLVGGGGYAEYARAWAEHLMAVPENMSIEEAACVSETYLTAWLNVFRLGELRDGEVVVLHGGGGGVNTAAIQLCRALVPSTRMVVTASTGKVQRVRELGAHLVVDYRNEDFAEAVKTFTEGRGADVILDHIGGPYLRQNMASLAVGGRVLQIGVMGGAKAEINLALLMVKRQRIIGSVLRSRPVEEKGAIIAAFAEAVLPHMAARRIVPLVHAVMPLEQVADAHRAMEASAHFGKIVLKVSD